MAAAGPRGRAAGIAAVAAVGAGGLVAAAALEAVELGRPGRPAAPLTRLVRPGRARAQPRLPPRLVDDGRHRRAAGPAAAAVAVALPGGRWRPAVVPRGAGAGRGGRGRCSGPACRWRRSPSGLPLSRRALRVGPPLRHRHAAGAGGWLIDPAKGSASQLVIAAASAPARRR